MPLRHYQQECLTACLKHTKGGLCILPTGSGKSHIIGELADRLNSNDVLVLTPRVILSEQNKLKIKTNAQCMTVHKAYTRKIFKKILIIDEAHFIQEKNGMFQYLMKEAESVYGFTATPIRLNFGHIGKIFNKKIYEISRERLIEDGFLVNRKYHFIPIDCVINIKDSAYRSNLALSKEVCPKTKKCIDDILKRNMKGPVLIFACDIHHALKIKESLFNFSSDIVHSKKDKKENNEIIQNFKSNKIKYLINCEILTTGFDFPELENIVILRPTSSYSLFEQICGRGDRPAKGKKYNNIYDYTINLYNFDFSVKNTNSIKTCMICGEMTNYKLNKCSHCHGFLIRGDTPLKTCKYCGEKNNLKSSYCFHCGKFIIINTYDIYFNSMSLFKVNKKTYAKFGKSNVMFKIKIQDFKKLYDTLKNKNSKVIKKITKVQNIICVSDLPDHVLFFKETHRKYIGKIIKILKIH